MTPDMQYAPPDDLGGRSALALKVGAVGLVACAFGYGFDPAHFFRSWLIAYLLFLGIALGSMGLLMVQHLSGGAWGVFRRIFEPNTAADGAAVSADRFRHDEPLSVVAPGTGSA